MNDQLPEITEEFTMTVKRVDGKEIVFEGKNSKTKLLYARIDEMAKEVLNGRRRTNQT